MKESQRHQLLSLCFQDYISQFKFKSVVAQDLIDFFLTYFPELKDAAVAQREGEELRSTPLCILSALISGLIGLNTFVFTVGCSFFNSFTRLQFFCCLWNLFQYEVPDYPKEVV